MEGINRKISYMGNKWTCLSLCGFALCGNMAYVAVSANSLAYDEDSSSDESYTNSNDYTENSFAEGITGAVKIKKLEKRKNINFDRLEDIIK